MKNNRFIRVTEEFDNTEKLILRDHLALERTRLANERTLFSYIRTALYLLTAGISILQIDSIRHLTALAWTCIIGGVFLWLTGLYRYFRTRSHIKSYNLPHDLI